MNDIIKEIARNSRRNEYGELVFDSAVCLREVIKIDAALPEIVGELTRKQLRSLSIALGDGDFGADLKSMLERELEVRFFENQLAIGKLVDQWKAAEGGHDRAYDREIANAL